MIIADLHIHSKYSRATSRECVPEALDLWSRRKGIGLLGTGDFTHHAWRQELSEKLQPAEDGLYTLKPELRLDDETKGELEIPRFVLSGEISSIYKKNGKTRKVHNVILLPSIQAAEELSRRLEAIGNLHSDGRPILGLDSRDLLEITLEACPEAIFIPAHIWTPHFSLFGAFSGFDSIEECFEDLTPYIHALETGLSSDPAMNRRVSALDGYTLVSNSDAHSPAKLGREANLLNIDYSFEALSGAIQGQKPESFLGTIEFFPEEGKYHLDGHRACKLCLKPSETEALHGRCPVCGKKLTIGVEHRVEELADRDEGCQPQNAKPFESLVPLTEVIAASTGCSVASVKVAAQYSAMLKRLGPEFEILRAVSIEEIGAVAGPCIQEGIRRLRCGQVERIPGYDGEYGVIQLLNETEIRSFSGQMSLFGADVPVKRKPAKKASLAKAPAGPKEEIALETHSEPPIGILDALNEEQKQAVISQNRTVAVIAGPGTGKTKTLIAKAAYLIQEQAVNPHEITAVTFTNKAAEEMRQRLNQQIGAKAAKKTAIGTFHSLCLQLLREVREDVVLLDEYAARGLAAEALGEVQLKLSPGKLLQEVSRRKNGLAPEEGIPEEAILAYHNKLHKLGVLDFDDLLIQCLALFDSGVSDQIKARFQYLLVDEFQDSNGLQYQLVKAWSKSGKQLFVIGDPDQSIYGFRGSNAECFDLLTRGAPPAEQIVLKKNYRSTPEIIGCALQAISKNGGQERSLLPQKPSGPRVRLVRAQSDLSEAIFIAKEINRMVGGVDMLDAADLRTRKEGTGARDFTDIAVLYRTRRQADLIEKCLQKESIPYLVAGRDDFLGEDTVRGCTCFYQSLLNPLDLVSLKTTLTAGWDCPKDLALSVVSFWAEIGNGLSFDRRLLLLEKEFGQSGSLRRWLNFMKSEYHRLKKAAPRVLLESWAREQSLTENPLLEKLMRTAVFHRDMPSFIEAVLFGRESDLMRSSSKHYTAGSVTLMTLHGSKGLEFPAVFLCGVKEGVLPLQSDQRPADLNEERRLFYVGMTRAKEELLLTGAGKPSAFLEGLPTAFSAGESADHPRTPAPEQQLSLFDLY